LEDETAQQNKHYPTAESDDDYELKEELVSRTISIAREQAEIQMRREGSVQQ
jgi:hypothetical protein